MLSCNPTKVKTSKDQTKQLFLRTLSPVKIVHPVHVSLALLLLPREREVEGAQKGLNINNIQLELILKKHTKITIRSKIFN